jgi:uncharacterized membrane protein
MKQNQSGGFNAFIKKLINYFLQGLLFVSPLGLTIYVILLIFNLMDGILLPMITDFLHFKIPGLGLLLMLVLITILGYFGQTVIANPFKLVVERLIQKAPLLNMVYTSIRDFMEAFVGKEKKFNQPVLMKVSSTSEMERMGFMTQQDLSDMNIKDKVAVYLPFCYAFSGEICVVPVSYVRPVDVPSGEWMKFIISGGVTRV